MGMHPVFEAARLRDDQDNEFYDHNIYDFASPPGEPTPAPQLSKGELGIADRLNWDMDHTTQSSYTPTQYVAPWDAEGWGATDVKTTTPTRIQTAQEQIDSQPLLPQRPGFRPGQRDYEYMPTAKEQRRERAANLATIARERGGRWQDTPLPGGNPAPEPTYGRWQDAELPNWQPAPGEQINPVRGTDPAPGEQINPVRGTDREWGEDLRPGEVGLIGYEGPGNPRWEKENPREVNIQPVPDRDKEGPIYGVIPEDDRKGVYKLRGVEGGWTPAGSDASDTGPMRPLGWKEGPIPPKPVGRPKGWEDTPIEKRGPARRSRAFDVRDTWRTPRSGRGISTSSTRNLGDRGIMTDRMRYYRR